MEWEFNDEASSAFPFYSRAIFGDLCPDPISPLTGSVGVGAELGPAWSRTYASLGHPLPETGRMPAARFGGYLYLNTSLFRLFGVVAAGADPMAFARQYLGERPDVPRLRDERGRLETGVDQLAEWKRGVLTRDPDLSAHARAARRVAELRAARPKLASRGDAELVARIEQLRGELREALRLYAHTELATALTCELLTRTTEDAGYPGLTGALVDGRSGTVTEEPAARLWHVARQVNHSEKLRRLFGQDTESLAEQLTSARAGELGRLRTALAAVSERYGHIGPAEWELAAPTWGTDIRLLLNLIAALCQADQAEEPAARAARRAERSAESSAVVRRSLRTRPEAAQRFDMALQASARWLLARHRIRQICSAIHHEQRLAARELGRRQVESGLLDQTEQVFMLLAGELTGFVSEPSSFAERLRMRAYDYHALALYQPPFVTMGAPPPVVRWPRAEPASARIGRRGLPGTATSQGTAIGPARVLRSAASIAQVRPGDVLVLPAGGPGWLPLLSVASGVVIDGGAALSEVAVAARDLGIPCVAATVDATSRINPGTLVEVDGFAGLVRVVEPTGGSTSPGGDRDGTPPSNAPAGPGARLSGEHGEHIAERDHRHPPEADHRVSRMSMPKAAFGHG